MKNLILVLLTLVATIAHGQIDQRKLPQNRVIAPSNIVYQCAVSNPVNIHTSFDTTTLRPRVGGIRGVVDVKVYVLSVTEYMAVVTIDKFHSAIFLLTDRKVINGGYEVYSIKMASCPQSVLDFLNPRVFYFHPQAFCYAIASEFGVVTYGNIPALSGEQLGFPTN